MKILFLATADTKSAAIDHVIRRSRESHEVSFIDISCLRLNKEHRHLYALLGKDPARLSKMRRGEAVHEITETLAENAAELVRAEHADVIIGIGGAGGSSILIEAIAQSSDLLPPLFLLTTVWRQLRDKRFNKYTIVIPAIADLDVLSSFSQRELTYFATMVDTYSAMLETFSGDNEAGHKKYIVTTLGSLHECLRNLVGLVPYADLISLHANGSSDVIRVLTEKYTISALLFLGSTEFSNFLFGGDFRSTQDPFELIRDIRIPVYFVPGGLEFIVTMNRGSERSTFGGRTYEWNQMTHLSELRADAAKVICDRLKPLFPSHGRNRILLPMKSFSQLSESSQAFADSPFVKAFSQALLADGSISVTSVNDDINSLEFATALATVLSL